MSRSDGSSGRRLAGGAGLLAVATLLANGGNYALNLVLGRWLSPAEFGDANLMVTLMLLATAIAVALQLIVAHAASIDGARDDAAHTVAVAAWVNRRAVTIGLAIGVVLAAGAPLWQDVFRTGQALPFAILGLGMPAYLAQSVGRGLLQGRLDFAPLAGSFLVEMVVRVGLGVGLVALGLGVVGATIALTASFVLTWVFVAGATRRQRVSRAGRRERRRGIRPERRTEIVRHAGPIEVLLLGQIVINNGDVLVVKSNFDEATAGLYAAVALGGRAVFFLSWAVVSTLFPAVAQRDERGVSTEGLLVAGVGLVSGLCLVMIGGAAVLGGPLLGVMLGEDYATLGPTMTRYAIATSLFAVANLIVTHRTSAGARGDAWLLVAGGAAQTVLLLTIGDTIGGIVTAQVVAMGGLLSVVALRPLVPTRAQRRARRREARRAVLSPGDLSTADYAQAEATG